MGKFYAKLLTDLNVGRGTVTFLPDKLQNETIQKMGIHVLYHHFGVRLSPSNLIAAPRDLP